MTQPPSNSFRRSRLSLAIGLCTLAATANAQTADDHRDPARTLDTIQVTGERPTNTSSPKLTAPLLDAPQTVVVIPDEVYIEQGARNLADVLRNTPGITYNAGENGFATGSGNFAIRGFESGDSIFIDGVRDSGNYSRDIYNIEQVEVHKGASGENGRGGAGGYVNLVTKTPRADNAYSGTVSYGTDPYHSIERKRAAIDLNQRIADSAAVRLNLLVQDGGVPGRDHTELNSVGFAPSLALGLGTPTRFSLAYQSLQRDDVPDWGVPGAVLPGITPSGNPDHEALTDQVDRSNFYGLTSDFDDVDSESILASLEHDLNAQVTLSNQLRYSNTDRDALYTVPGGLADDAVSVGAARQAFDRENRNLSNLSNLTAAFDTSSVQHHLSAGLDLTREQAQTGRVFAELGSVEDTNLYDPDPLRTISGTVDLTPGFIDTAEIDSMAVYVYDTMTFSPQWQLTGGVRLERSDTRIRTRATDGGLTSEGELPEDQDARYDRKDTTVAGKLGLVYKPVDNASLYGSVGRSVLPPGSFLSNPDGSRGGLDQSFPNLLGQNNPESDEQVSINYELGAKWDFNGGRLATTAALFRTDRSNIAMAPDDEGGFAGYGEQTVQGLELGVSGAITAAWSVFGGMLFLDTERRHGPEIDAALTGGDYTLPDGTVVTTTSGDELAFSPDFSANLWTTYRFDNGLTLGGGVVHVEDSFVGRPDNTDRVVANGARGELPGYTVLNLVASYALTPNLTLRLNVDNATDELYGTSTNWSVRRVELGGPRSYLLSADFSF